MAQERNGPVGWYRNLSFIYCRMDILCDYGGMGLTWRRYEMAAAAMRKIEIENASFYRKFNEKWYATLNALVKSPNLLDQAH